MNESYISKLENNKLISDTLVAFKIPKKRPKILRKYIYTEQVNYFK